MKHLIAVLALAFSVGAFAQERVELNSKKISVKSDKALLVRSAKTPSKLEITFLVPMANSVCERYSTRVVVVTSSSQCGYVERSSGYTTRTVCVQRNPRNNQCVRTRTERVPVVSRYPRTCPVTETYCSQYGTTTSYESDKVKIKFKNMPKLGGSEEETFTVKARQRSYDGENVVYDIEPTSTLNGNVYEVKSKGALGYDSYTISPK